MIDANVAIWNFRESVRDEMLMEVRCQNIRMMHSISMSEMRFV